MLKTQLDTLEGVDEKFHSLYEEKDGKFTLTGVELPDTSGLKKALDAEREEKKTYAEQLKELTKKVDADKLKTAEKNNDIEAVKAEMVKLHQAELETANTRANDFEKKLNTLMIDNAALDAITKERGIPELLMPIVKGRAKLNEGKVEVLTSEGKPMVDKEGNSVGLLGLVKELKENALYAGAFQGSSHTGGNSKGENAGQGASQKSSMDKIASGLQKLKAGA